MENKAIDFSLELKADINDCFSLVIGLNRQYSYHNYRVSHCFDCDNPRNTFYSPILSASYQNSNYIFEIIYLYIDGLDIYSRNKENRSLYFKSYKTIELSVSYMFEVIGKRG